MRGAVEDMDRATRFRPVDTLLVEEHHGTVYVIPLGAAPVRLNRPASLLWRVFAAGASPGEAERPYLEAYECSADEAAEDVRNFVASCLEAGFLRADRPVSP